MLLFLGAPPHLKLRPPVGPPHQPRQLGGVVGGVLLDGVKALDDREKLGRVPLAECAPVEGAVVVPVAAGLRPAHVPAVEGVAGPFDDTLAFAATQQGRRSHGPSNFERGRHGRSGKGLG